MSSIVRTLVLCLLALALPLQGLAAATMLHCGPSHHARIVSASAAHDHAAHGHGAARGAHSHDDRAADGSAAVDAANPQTPNYLGDSSLAKAKCSACASCCSAVALPASIAEIPVVQQHASRFPPLSAQVEPVVTDSPERPPRSFLA
jgi:hypothetical protein